VSAPGKNAPKTTRAAKTVQPTAFSKAAIKANLDSPAYFGQGLQGLKGEHKSLVKPKNTKRLTHSLNLDDAMKAVAPGDSRWDYGIGTLLPDGRTEVVVWVEVHSATTSEVSRFLKKHEWLKQWMAKQPAFDRLTKAALLAKLDPFLWVATETGVHIQPGSPQSKKLALCGIKIPQRIVTLP
jgi:hypothetical protein